MERARRVEVGIGRVRREQSADTPALACLLGVRPPGTPPLARALGASLVRQSHARADRVAFEQFRLRADQPLDAIPGLDGPVPSRLRDAVRLAFAAGAGELELIVLAAPDVWPWELGHPSLAAARAQALDGVPGAAVALPDLGGPFPVWDRQRPDPARVADAARAALEALGPIWRENYQTGLFDVPAGPVPAGVDAVPCGWVGGAAALARQGWRAACAAAVGRLGAGSFDLMRSLDGERISLGAGRAVRGPRALQPVPPPVASPDLPGLWLVLDAAGDTALVDRELSLRTPVGSWPLPALRTAKAIHYQIRSAAERFVFEPVEPVQAFALAAALDIALQPFVDAGVLVGPGGEGAPEVEADVVRDPDAPGFLAQVEARLLPWCQRVHVQLGVNGGRVVAGGTA